MGDSQSLHRPTSRGRALQVAALLWLVFAGPSALTQVTGVVQTSAATPIAGAVVRWPAFSLIPEVRSAADGSFSIVAPGSGSHELTAALRYDQDRPDRYEIRRQQVNVDNNGQGTVVIVLERVPGQDNQSYLPIKAARPGGCGDCHGEYLAQWQQSRHSGAALSPWVHDLHNGGGTPGGTAGYVYRDLHDDGETGVCAVCHVPNQNPRAAGSVQLNEAIGASPLEGVNCASCHQLADFNENLQAIHLLGDGALFFPGATGSPGTHSRVWGPLPDSAAPGMNTMYKPELGESHFCASCHEYVNPDTGAPGQQTYSEWAASTFAQPGQGFRSCQDCHMPPTSAGTIADVERPGAIQRPAEQRNDHRFLATATGMLAESLSLQTQIVVEGDVVRVGVRIENAGLGHAFPTGVDIRNALLSVRAEGNSAALGLLEGPVLPWWADDDVPGQQAGDLAGQPGFGMAKVLAGRINGQGAIVQPVPFIDAELVAENSTLQPGEVRERWWRFANPGVATGQTVQIQVDLLYRRAWRALAVTKDWQTRPDGRPVEQLVTRAEQTRIVDESMLDRIYADGFGDGVSAP